MSSPDVLLRKCRVELKRRDIENRQRAHGSNILLLELIPSLSVSEKMFYPSDLRKTSLFSTVLRLR